MADLLGRGAVPVLALLLAGGCVEDRGAPGGPDAGTDSSTAEAVTDVPASDAADPDLPPELPADGLLPGEDTQVTCEPGTKQCQDGDTALLCMGGLWVVSQECQAGQLCLDGACVPAEDCAPGVISGCWSFTARKLCHPSGKGWVPAPCAADEQCLDGVCATLTCVPGTKQCASPTAFQECLADGSDWGPLQGCAETESCVGGACLDACAGDIKYNRSSVGCEFWSVDLGQWDVKPGESSIEPSASTIPHAVVVGNPGEQPVTVTFQTGDGTPVAVGNPVIPPGQSRAFLMPVFSLQYTGIFRKTIRLRTNRPVTAAQFNPPNNEDFVHTSDASLLYPTTILGKEHYAVTTASRLGPTMPVIGKMPSTWGYVTVVAVEPGLTGVTVGPLSAPTEAGEGVEAHAKGDTFTVELEQWEVLNLQ
ncbi:MAG: IgGFc-binding protein, partial [Deltaproteobacteria bacterium]|nr:IgGFc-binding protein [Deltaproteobacteria bacterium]